MEPIKMPNHLDDQYMVLLWSSDELLPAVALISVGILFSQKILGLLLAIGATKLYRRSKEGHADGYLLHVLYWWGFVGGKESRTMPNPYIREYIR